MTFAKRVDTVLPWMAEKESGHHIRNGRILPGARSTTLHTMLLLEVTREATTKSEPSYISKCKIHSPVLVSKKHFELDLPEEDVKKHEGEEVEEDDWVIQPMSWGLVPHWSSEPKTSGYSMINARHDGVLSKTTFKRPLEKGRRCVVLADGWVAKNINDKKD